MATNYQEFIQHADETALSLTRNSQNWTAFLTTAARLYKYPFHEQLMIYSQRPEATACAEFDVWNKRMGRYVKRGSKGIMVADGGFHYEKTIKNHHHITAHSYDFTDSISRRNPR